MKLTKDECEAIISLRIQKAFDTLKEAMDFQPGHMVG